MANTPSSLKGKKEQDVSIKLFGHKECHKTQLYRSHLEKKGVQFVFLDVHEDDAAANELRSLYTTAKLNFPTILIGTKKLRNPKLEDLDKWLESLMK